MLELELLVLQRGRDAMVLSLFYKLCLEDLKSPINLSRWRSIWKEKVGLHIDEWIKAVQILDSFDGEFFAQGISETAYIKKVVQCSYTLVPCHVPYDIPSIQGHQCFVEKLARKVEHVKARSACMVGLHGVGGLGKITLCKSMVNFYTFQYLGMPSLIKSSSGGDKSKIMLECKMNLKKLMNLSNECLLNEANGIDEVVHLMREDAKGYDVFLAIDNVWESSREKAERHLRVGYSATSKILVTSRSEQVLHGWLIERADTSYVGLLSAVEHEEAFQIFQIKLGDLSSGLVDKD